MVLALDFDGVVADSVVECMTVSKKVYSELNPSSDMSTKNVLETFRKLRVYARNPYHFLPILKAIDENVKISSDGEFFDYAKKSNKKISNEFFRRFYEERTFLQDKDIKKWIGLNPQFKNIADKLKNTNLDKVYIVTSKDEKSVRILMEHYGIKFPEQRILDNRVTDKIKKLRMLGCPLDEVHFVDDILSNIIPIKKRTPVKCYLAVWGYNNEAQRKEAESMDIELLDEGRFGELIKHGV